VSGPADIITVFSFSPHVLNSRVGLSIAPLVLSARSGELLAIGGKHTAFF
jgi:hypothetical protein